jgi:hypothetical protein
MEAELGGEFVLPDGSGDCALPRADGLVEERDCGTIGNVLVIAGHARDMGKPEAAFKEDAAEALRECQRENGLDGCSVRNEAQQRTVDSMFDFLWAHPTADGTDFATEFYHECQARASKPM